MDTTMYVPTELLKNNMDKIDWDYLSLNPAAIDLLKENPDKIYWPYLSSELKQLSIY